MTSSKLILALILFGLSKALIFAPHTSQVGFIQQVVEETTTQTPDDSTSTTDKDVFLQQVIEESATQTPDDSSSTTDKDVFLQQTVEDTTTQTPDDSTSTTDKDVFFVQLGMGPRSNN